MNEQPTPETDIEHLQFAMGGFTLDFCRKLERERDEAREELAKIESLLLDPHAVFLNFLHGKIAKLDWAKLEHIHGPHPALKERDEARGVASGLAKQAERLCKERDEARNKMADALQEVDLRTLDYERMKQERDEAREKWKEQNEALRTLAEHGENEIQKLIKERDEVQRELNEIRAERDLARLSSMESDQVHDRMVGELEKVYKELDKARKDFEEEKKFHNRTHSELVQTQCKLMDLTQAIIVTLEENRHLADGDDCTLAKLKSVVPEWK